MAGFALSWVEWPRQEEANKVSGVPASRLRIERGLQPPLGQCLGSAAVAAAPEGMHAEITLLGAPALALVGGNGYQMGPIQPNSPCVFPCKFLLVNCQGSLFDRSCEVTNPSLPIGWMAVVI